MNAENTGNKFDRFTQRAKKVLILTQEEAQRLQHNYMGTEHLLLGLLREGGGAAAQSLTRAGVTLQQMRSAVEVLIKRGDHMVLGAIGLTPRAMKVVDLGIAEADRLNQHAVGTGHILLGMLREGGGVSVIALREAGVNLDELRAQTIQLLESSPEDDR